MSNNQWKKKPDPCETCQFFVKETEGVVLVNGASSGHCRRYPPTVTMLVVGGGVVPVTTFPSVQGDMWCGEHIDNIEF